MKNGRVIINRNICDNAPECSGIAICPSGAIFWNEKNENIDYNPDICIDCGACADANAGGCPIGAILWGEDEDDYIVKKTKVENETRKLADLEVERYGASPIEPTTDYEDINVFINSSKTSYVLIEFFNDDSINCLLHSIRVSEIKKVFDNNANYIKVQVENKGVVEEYEIGELPGIAVFKEGNFKGSIAGYYDDNATNSFFDKLSKLK